MRKTITAALAATALGIAFYSCRKDLNVTPDLKNESVAQSSVSPGGEYVPDEVLVQFKKSTLASAKDILFAKFKGTVKRRLLSAGMKQSGVEEIVTLKVAKGSVMEVIAKLLQEKDIAHVSPNYICHAAGGPNDGWYQDSHEWGMYNTVEAPAILNGARAASAWKNGFTGSQNVWVGILDCGFKYTHADLLPNWGAVPGEIPNNGIDDDGNGYVDDVYGYDFLNHDNTIFDGPANESLHGMNVAGIIGAKGNNGTWMTGVNWDVKMLGAKWLDVNESGTVSNAIEAIYYFINLKSLHSLNLVAINNSWNTSGNSSFLQQAMDAAQQAGILMVCSAGNDGSNIDAQPSYPASCTNANVISVAGIDTYGNLFDLGGGFKSSYGANSVDIAAPGKNIFSLGFTPNGDDAMSLFTGTSQATPFVTGAAALYKAANPNATYAQIKQRILDTKRPMPSLQGKCVTGGILDIGSVMGGGPPNLLDGGIYTIISAVNNSSVIDVTNGYKTDGTKLQLYISNGSNSQKWLLRYDQTYGLVIFKSMLDTTKVMDLTGHATANGTPMEIWTYNDGDNQKLGFSSFKGYYGMSPLTAFGTNKWIDVNGGSAANGTKIQLWDQASGGYTGAEAPKQLFSILYTPYLAPGTEPLQP